MRLRSLDLCGRLVSRQQGLIPAQEFDRCALVFELPAYDVAVVVAHVDLVPFDGLGASIVIVTLDEMDGIVDGRDFTRLAVEARMMIRSICRATVFASVSRN